MRLAEANLLIRKLKGSTQSVLARCSDGLVYVIKFTNNPLGKEALVGEIIMTRVAKYLRIPVPDWSYISVDRWLIDHTPDVRLEKDGKPIRYSAGIHLGSATPYSCLGIAQVLSFLPPGFEDRIGDLASFTGALVLDAWVGSMKPRKVIFTKDASSSALRPLFLGYHSSLLHVHYGLGGCDVPTHFSANYYDSVTGWDSFEPWLNNVESLRRPELEEMTQGFSEEWRIPRSVGKRCANYLWRRRQSVRGSLQKLTKPPFELFRNWGKSLSPSAAPAVGAVGAGTACGVGIHSGFGNASRVAGR